MIILTPTSAPLMRAMVSAVSWRGGSMMGSVPAYLRVRVGVRAGVGVGVGVGVRVGVRGKEMMGDEGDEGGEGDEGDAGGLGERPGVLHRPTLFLDCDADGLVARLTKGAIRLRRGGGGGGGGGGGKRRGREANHSGGG